MTNHSMDKNERISFALQYGLREDEILKETEQMVKDNILPKSKNEIFRRGLHACRYLAEVDEKFLLTLLSETLHKLSKYYFPMDLKLAKDLALTVYAIKISKQGAESAEIFETIVHSIEIFNQIRTQHLNAEQEVDLCKEIEKIAISLDTIFLKPKMKEHDAWIMYLNTFRQLLSDQIISLDDSAKFEKASKKPSRKIGVKSRPTKSSAKGWFSAEPTKSSRVRTKFKARSKSDRTKPKKDNALQV